MKNVTPVTPPAADRPDRELLDDPDILEFATRLPEARKVSIKVLSETGSWKHKGSVAIDWFNLDNVQRRYGGGVYQFSFHRADGRLLKTVTNIEIDDLPEDEREPEPSKTAAIVPAISEIQLLREQMSADRTLMLEMIRSLGKSQPAQQPQSSMTEMVTALVQLHGIQPKHTNPPEVQELLMKSFTSGLELAAKINKTTSGETSPLGEVFGFVREVFQEARPLIQTALANAGHPAPKSNVLPGGTVNPPDSEEEDVTADLKPALAFVKDQLKNGMAPTALAEIVLGQMQQNPEMDEVVSNLIADEPIENFLEMEPELKAEPLRTTFGQFFGVMRARIFAARDSGGDTGNPANTGTDAGADTTGR